LDKKTNKPKGLGFIIFKTEEGSSHASTEMDGVDLNGKEINVNIALGK
jgi:RNA recognition motif-containing protein